MLLLLLLTAYLRLQNRRFGRAQIFKSQVPFIYAGFPDDTRRQATTDCAGWSPTLSAIISFSFCGRDRHKECIGYALADCEIRLPFNSIVVFSDPFVGSGASD